MDSTTHTAPSVVNPLGNENRKFGIWLFLSSELLIFCGLIVGFLVLKEYAIQQKIKWGEVGGSTLILVTVNTFLLLASSYFVVKGIEAIKSTQTVRIFPFLRVKMQPKIALTFWILAAGVFGALFLLGQYYEYSNLISHEGHAFFGLIPGRGPFENADPFGSAFFTLTGLHGLHVFVGTLWAFLVAWRAGQGAYHAGNIVSVEMFGLYWHFVDLVWVLIFTVVYLLGV